jgi:hypothetical protein
MDAPLLPPQTKESRKMVQRMLETIGSTKKPKARIKGKARVIAKR